MNNKYLVLSVALLAIGIALAGYFVSKTLYNAKVSINTAQVMGLAERRVTSDLARWNIKVNVVGKSADAVPSLYEKIEKDRQSVKDVLLQNGFSEDEITVSAVHYTKQENRNKDKQIVDEVHTLFSTLEVETKEIEKVASARSKVGKLITQGVTFRDYGVRYSFNGLNTIKPDMLKEATQNARIAADEFAKNAGTKVGHIRNAVQGRFTITDAGQQYGDSAKIEKDIRVINTIEFYLTD